MLRSWSVQSDQCFSFLQALNEFDGVPLIPSLKHLRRSDSFCEKLTLIAKKKILLNKTRYFLVPLLAKPLAGAVMICITSFLLLACVAIFSVSFQASGSHARARGQRWQKISGGGGGERGREGKENFPFLPTPSSPVPLFALAPCVRATSPWLPLSPAKRKRKDCYAGYPTMGIYVKELAVFW